MNKFKPTKKKIVLSFLFFLILSLFPIVPQQWAVRYIPYGSESGWHFTSLINLSFSLSSLSLFFYRSSFNLILFILAILILFFLSYVLACLIPKSGILVISVLLLALGFAVCNWLMFRRSAIKEIPQTIDASQVLLLEIDLFPKNKKYDIGILLRNLNNPRDSLVVGTKTEISNRHIAEIDLSEIVALPDNRYEFVVSLLPQSNFLFYEPPFLTNKIKSNSFSIEASSQSLKFELIDIYGKKNPQREAGEGTEFLWAPFVGVDTIHGLKDLCEQGRCFELVWKGEGVKFYDGYIWAVEEHGSESITTQESLMRCQFKGQGKQKITREIMENGKIIGSDIYEYEVVGGEPGESTLCAPY